MKEHFIGKEFLSKFIKISLPVMIHAFVTFIVSFVDNIMVGSISNEAVSGVYAANQATFIFIIATFGLISGSGIMIQQFFGAKDSEHQMQSFRMKIIFGTCFLLIIIPMYYLFAGKLINFYTASDSNSAAIYEQGMKYINLAIISYIPYVYSACYSTSLRETARTKIAMIGGVAAFVTNVILNSLFIYVFNMGVQGAAYATIIARFVELITLVVLSHKAKCEFCHGAYTQLFSIDDFLIKRICKKSVLLFVNEIFWVTGMVMVSLAYSQRDGVLSSLSIVSTMGDVFSIVFQGLSVGIGVLVGSSLGAGEYEQAKTYVKKFYILGILIAASVGLLFACLSPVIPMLYSKVEPSQKKLATELIAIYSCFIPFFATSAISYTILKTGGKTFTTFMLDSVLFWVLFIPLAWILAKLTTVPLIVIYIVVQSCDIVKSIIGIIIISKGSWIQNLTVQNETSKVEEVKLNNI